jgi:hypothetical protein
LLSDQYNSINVDIPVFFIHATCIGQELRPLSGNIKKNIKGKTERIKEDASPLQYYSDLN